MILSRWVHGKWFNFILLKYPWSFQITRLWKIDEEERAFYLFILFGTHLLSIPMNDRNCSRISWKMKINFCQQMKLSFAKDGNGWQRNKRIVGIVMFLQLNHKMMKTGVEKFNKSPSIVFIRASTEWQTEDATAERLSWMLEL